MTQPRNSCVPQFASFESPHSASHCIQVFYNANQDADSHSYPAFPRFHAAHFASTKPYLTVRRNRSRFTSSSFLLDRSPLTFSTCCSLTWVTSFCTASPPLLVLPVYYSTHISAGDYSRQLEGSSYNANRTAIPEHPDDIVALDQALNVLVNMNERMKAYRRGVWGSC